MIQFSAITLRRGTEVLLEATVAPWDERLTGGHLAAVVVTTAALVPSTARVDAESLFVP